MVSRKIEKEKSRSSENMIAAAERESQVTHGAAVKHADVVFAVNISTKGSMR